MPAGVYGSVSAPTVSVAPSCPLALGDVDAEKALQANRNLNRALEEGELSVDEFTRIADRIFEGDANADVLVRTIAEGDDDAARFIADADSQALADYTALRNEPGIDEETLREFAQTVDKFDATGRDRAAIIDGLSDAGDDALANFFRFGGRASGEVSEDLAQSVRRRLVPEYNKGRLSAKALGEIGDNIDVLDTDSRVSGVDRVLRSVVNAKKPSRQNFQTNIRGNLYEIRTARGYIRGRLDDSDELQLSFEPFDADSKEQIKDIIDDRDRIEQLAEELNQDPDSLESRLKKATKPGSKPEFDGFRIKSQEGVTYYESKSGRVTESDIRKKSAFLKAYTELNGVDDADIIVLSRLPRSDSDIESGAVEYLNNRSPNSFVQFGWDYES